MSNLRILFVCHGHPTLQPGGTEIFAHDLFHATKATGQVEAMFLGCVSRLHRSQRDGVEFQTLGRSADELLLWVGGFDRLMLAQTRSLPVATAFARLLTAFNPDIVHFHHLTLVGLEALAMVRRFAPAARIVVTLHDYHLICANDGLLVNRSEGTLCRMATEDACARCFPEIGARRFALRNLHVRSLLALVDRFIAPSRWVRDRHIQWGLAPVRIEVIRNGLPALPVASGGQLSDPWSCEGSQPVVFGVFGNLAPHKGPLLALAAARRLSEAGHRFTLRLHGALGFQDEAFRVAFQAALAAAPSAVHRGGYVREEVSALMAAVDWVVVPSQWWENAPLVVLEAFRHGRPVICTDAGGLPELVHHGISGLLVPLGDEGELAAAMARAIQEPGLRERLKAGIPRVPTIDTVAEHHLALYWALQREREVMSA